MSSIYISGQITGTDDYMERFAEAEKQLTERGYTVINPAKINANLPENTPYKRYIDISLELLRGCDSIYMLDGWEESKGARLEYYYAETMGYKILHQMSLRKSQKKKKYYWRSKVKSSHNQREYLNLYENDITLDTTSEACGYVTKFTESEYKQIAKIFDFPEDMFVKEGIG